MWCFLLGAVLLLVLLVVVGTWFQRQAPDLREHYSQMGLFFTVFLLGPLLVLVGIVWFWLGPAVWVHFTYRPVTATVVEQGSPRSRAQRVLVAYRVEARDYVGWVSVPRRTDGYPSSLAVGERVTVLHSPLGPDAVAFPSPFPWEFVFVVLVVAPNLLIGLVILYFTPGDHYDALAAHHRARGRYRLARDLARKAVAWRRRPLERRIAPTRLAAALTAVAVPSTQLGDYAEAREALREAASLARRPRPWLIRLLHWLGLREREDVGYARLLDLRGGVALLGCDFAEALALHREALALRRDLLGSDHPGFANSLHNLAVVHVRMGDLAAAEPLLRQALAIAQAHVKEDRPGCALTLNALSSLRWQRGDYAEAERLLGEALTVLRASPDEHRPRLADVLGNLATLRKQMGNYAEADALYRQALAIRRDALGESTPAYADGLNNLATFLVELYDWTGAERLLRQAQAIYQAALGEEHPSCARVLLNLAGVADRTSTPAEAEQLAQRALRIFRESFGESHPDFATGLACLARLYARSGRYAEAEPLYRQALAIRRAVLGERHPIYALTLNNLALLYQHTGSTAAEPLQRQAGEILRAAHGENHPDHAVIERNLGVLAARAGRVREGLARLRHAADIDDRTIGLAFSIGSEGQRLAYLTGVQDRWHASLALVAALGAADPEAVCWGFDLVLRRKALAAEALAVQREAVLGGRHPELRGRFQELAALRRRVAHMALAGPTGENASTHEQVLAGWNAERERLEAELARLVPELNLEQRLRGADRHAVARALPEGSALVEIVCISELDLGPGPHRPEVEKKPARYLAFVLPAGEPAGVRLVDLGPPEAIDRLVASFRARLTGEAEHQPRRELCLIDVEQAPEGSGNEGAALRAAVFDPLAAVLGSCTRLLLAPDGDLMRLPFEVLPTADGLRLIDQHRISYLGCGRDVLRLAARPACTAEAPVVAADPDFDLAGTGAAAEGPALAGRCSRDLADGAPFFAALPGTRREAAQVAERLGVRPWLGPEVLEARLKEVRSPRILHLATHGFFLSDQQRDPGEQQGWVAGEELGRLSGLRLENPLLRSGLALAGANTWLRHGQVPAEAEDGLLTAEDVTGIDLSATELVVLSACQTGLGQVHTGEGVFGLRRAFVLAGVRTLVMSLWKVPDLQTEELMTAFYHRLLSGEGRAEALRQAQLALKQRCPDPLAWGAFVCVGDPGPLEVTPP
jgi:CHAT domain-containing protein/tetratricopeptide (TPR) repeat protein